MRIFYRRISCDTGLQRASALINRKGFSVSNNILYETRQTPGETARKEKKSIATVWRWMLTGCRGVRLESILLGGRRITSKEAVERFVAKLSESGSEPQNDLAGAMARREADIEAAENELSAASA